MSEAKRSCRKRAMLPVHAHAAAIDIGATLNVAAVGTYARQKRAVRPVSSSSVLLRASSLSP